MKRVLAVVVLLACQRGVLAADAGKPPAVVAPRAFSLDQLAEPEAVFWPAYFWFWNGPLDDAVLSRQLADMRAHDARGVCVVPMPRDFRPDTTANQLDVEYLSNDFFAHVRAAVEQAERLGMHYWLYDEGGWPSGQATGRVVRARPDLAAQVMHRDAAGHWSLARNAGRPDLLNPHSTATFVELTHERYRAAVGGHFGKTIKLVFTDEPAVESVAPGRQIPWTAGAEELFREHCGYDIVARLEAFRNAAPEQLGPPDEQTRIDYFDFWSDRFRESYFEPLRRWSRASGLAHGGHLGGEDETIGAARYGFGHLLRQFRAMDVPGVDIIWRQVFPGQPNHHFPKFASSAARQNGTALALSESFCVYGNGLTPAQMKWLIDYQYVRGLNVLVPGCYPLSTRDHLMAGERPHFGPVDPLWDFLPDLHRYTARLGYLMACGQADIDTALYLPVRDIWAACGQCPAARNHDALAGALTNRQIDYDVIDDDLLSDPATRIAGDRLATGPVSYRTIVVGENRWMAPASKQKLADFEAGGGRVLRLDSSEQSPARLSGVAPTVGLQPATGDLRAARRFWPGGSLVFLFNEGPSHYQGQATFRCDYKPVELNLATGSLTQYPGTNAKGVSVVPIRLEAGQSLVLVCSAEAAQAAAARRESWASLMLDDAGWTARVAVRHAIGEHDYELRPAENSPEMAIALGAWQSTFGAGFSGRVTYRRNLRLPPDWRGKRVRLQLQRVEHAARVRLDGRPLGDLLWSPWSIELPVIDDNAEHVLEIDVANTLANVLTSAETQTGWSRRSGPGWPGPYHERALRFERESPGGGLFGPVRLELLAD